MIGWVVLLYGAGLVLVFAEFFVPGGICGSFGGIAIVASCVLGIYYYPQYAVFIVLAELMGAVVGIILGIKFFPRTRVGKVMVLDAQQKPSEGWVSTISETSLMGAIGEVFTPLRPAGTIVVNGRRLDAVADGSLIERGAKVRIIDVRGSRIVVEELKEGTADT